jgi:hypothetical protein
LLERGESDVSPRAGALHGPATQAYDGRIPADLVAERTALALMTQAPLAISRS